LADSTITSFTTTPESKFEIGGSEWGVDTAGESYSLTNPDSQTLRFEVRPGDYASYDSSSVDRSEISGEYIPGNIPIGINYQFMVEPNGANNTFTNTASWLLVGQMHDGGTVSGTSPPFAMQLEGDHLQLVARYVEPGGNPSNGSSDLHMLTLWTDPNPIVPGQYYDINILANVSNTGGGLLKLSVNGDQVVNYSGPLGFGSSQVYWEEGVYRNAGPTETVTANYRDFTLLTGSEATAPTAPTTPTEPTAPATPTTPTSPNLAPTVTQASASPGTGIADNGDTITMTLGFSEAVTVTGTPALALNNGDTATYVGGSGTSSLTFKTTVAPTDKDTSAVAITGVNLPSGASIKDLSGLAANLSGAVKTFTGLRIDATATSPTTPTSPTAPANPTTPTAPTTPSSVTKPVVTVADNSLSVAGRGDHVDLGTTVTTTDSNDSVSLNIRGLPKYETITTGDGTTFRGDNITLSSAQVASGLTLTSHYRGNAHPVADLTLTASARDPVTGAVTSAAPQTITVTDPRSSDGSSHTTAASTGSLANKGFAQLQQRLGSDTSTLATTAPQTTAWADQGSAKASQASQSFALLNQHMAGSCGRVDAGQIVAAASNRNDWTQNSLLTKPQH
jgi:hypothetical protein